MKYKITTEFYIKQTKQFTVSCKAWPSIDILKNKTTWNWNVYAYIYPKHPLNSDPQQAMDRLPFNGGITYDKLQIVTPALGVRRDWEKETRVLVLGNDYGHIWNNYDNHQSPEEGIPSEILDDALEVIEALETWVWIERGGE